MRSLYPKVWRPHSRAVVTIVLKRLRCTLVSQDLQASSSPTGLSVEDFVGGF